jgi:hypothetical protein
MTHDLVRLERLNVSGTRSQASAIRCEAADLRRDINEAQTLIDLLQLRYLNANGLRPAPLISATVAFSSTVAAGNRITLVRV